MHKYESDMTRREKRRQEKEKLHSMSFGKKLEYLWMYYKVWLVVLIILIGCVCTGFEMYRGMQENVLVSAALIDSGTGDTKGLEEGFKEYIKAAGRHDTVRVNKNVTDDNKGLTSQTLLTTLIGADAVDVLLCPEDTYQEYSEQGGFLDLKAAFSNDGGDIKFTAKKDGILIGNNDKIQEMTGISYTTIYAAVLINGEHQENGVQFIRYLAQMGI